MAYSVPVLTKTIRGLRAFALVACANFIGFSAWAACGPFPGDYPLSSGSELEIKAKVTINGNAVADGKTGADSVLDMAGGRSTVSQTLPDLDPASFPANGSSMDADEDDSPFSGATDVYYDEIKIDKNKTVAFSGGGPFHIDKLEVKERSTINLAAGTYYIDELKLEKEVTLNVTSGPVLIHIGEKADIKKDVEMNGGGDVVDLRFFLHTDAEFKADMNLDFTGLILGPSAKEVELKKDTDFHGAIVTGGKLKVEKDTTLTYTADDQVAVGGVSTCPTASLGHFSIDHDGSAVNCQADPIVISAHLDDHSVDTSYVGSVNLTTSTSHGDWSTVSANGVLVNSGNGAASYTFVAADSGSVTLALSNTFQEATNINVTDASINEDAGEDADIVYAASGFAFLADTVQNAIGNQIAGKNSGTAPQAQTIELQAVRTSDQTGACEAAFVNSVDIDLAFECRDPVTCAGEQVSVNGTDVAANSSGSVGAFTAVGLDFGDSVDTTAPITLVYPDAGRIRLHARYDIPMGGSSSGNLMTGTSNSFVVRPFGFDIDFADDRRDNGTGGQSYAADENGSTFRQAGESFSTTVSAVIWSSVDDGNNDGLADGGADLSDNATTPNFGQESASADATIVHSLNQPVGGRVGLISGGLFTSFTSGSATNNMTYDDVGIIDFSASHTDYLASGMDIAGSVVRVGRFYPARFEVAANTPVFRDGQDGAWTCGFTYMDQTFAFATNPVITVTGKGLSGGTTMNYGGDFWKFGGGPYLPGRQFADTGLDAPLTGSPTTTGHSNLDGIHQFTLSGELFTYDRAVLGLVAPFSADVTLTLANTDLMDSDGACYHPSDPSCNGVGQAQAYAVGGISGAPGSSMRFGRLELRNAVGSERLALALPAATQYYNGVGFATNPLDNCTNVSMAALDLANDDEDPAQGDADIAIDGGTSTASIANAPLIGGEMGLSFSSPGTGNTGYADLSVNLTSEGLSWLLFDWDGDGAHDDNPVARASFGLYSGSSYIIDFREPW